MRNGDRISVDWGDIIWPGDVCGGPVQKKSKKTGKMETWYEILSDAGYYKGEWFPALKYNILAEFIYKRGTVY